MAHAPLLEARGALDDHAAIAGGVVAVSGDTGVAAFGTDGRLRHTLAAARVVEVAVDDAGTRVAALTADGRIGVLALADGRVSWRASPGASQLTDVSGATLALTKDGDVVVATRRGFFVARASATTPLVPQTCTSTRARNDDVVCLEGSPPSRIVVRRLDGAPVLSRPLPKDILQVEVSPDGTKRAQLVRDGDAARVELVDNADDAVLWSRPTTGESLAFVTDGVAVAGAPSVVHASASGDIARVYLCHALHVDPGGKLAFDGGRVCGTAPVLPWQAEGRIFPVDDPAGRFLVGDRLVEPSGKVVGRFGLSCDGVNDSCFIEGPVGRRTYLEPLALDGDALLASRGPSSLERITLDGRRQDIPVPGTSPSVLVCGRGDPGTPSLLFSFDDDGMTAFDQAGRPRWRRADAVHVLFSRDCKQTAVELRDGADIDVVVVDPVTGADRGVRARLPSGSHAAAISDSGARVLVESRDGFSVLTFASSELKAGFPDVTPVFIGEELSVNGDAPGLDTSWSEGIIVTVDGRTARTGGATLIPSPRHDRLMARFFDGLVADLGSLRAPRVLLSSSADPVSELHPDAGTGALVCLAGGGCLRVDETGAVAPTSEDDCAEVWGKALRGETRLLDRCVELESDECVGGPGAVLARDGTLVASGGQGGTVLVWDVARRAVRLGLPVGPHVKPLAVSADRLWLGADSAIHAVDGKGAPVWTLPMPADVGAAAPDGTFAFAAAEHGLVVVSANGEVLLRRAFPVDEVTALAFDDDARVLWVGTRRGGVYALR